MRRRRGTLIIVIGIALLGVADWSPAQEHVDTDPVRDALRQHRYPWYDRATDSHRRLAEPREEQTGSSWFDSWFGGEHRWDSQRPKSSIARGTTYLLQQGMSFTVMLAIAAAIIVLLLVLFRSRRIGITGTNADDGHHPHRQGRFLATETTPEIDDFLNAAHRCAMQGDLRQAIILLFNHQLMILDMCQLVRLTPGLTNRQYLRQLSGHRTYDIFQRSVCVFETIAFGGQQANSDTYEAMLKCTESLERSSQTKFNSSSN